MTDVRNGKIQGVRNIKCQMIGTKNDRCSDHLTFYVANTLYFYIPDIDHFFFRSPVVFHLALPVLLRTARLYQNNWVVKRTTTTHVRKKSC